MKATARIPISAKAPSNPGVVLVVVVDLVVLVGSSGLGVVVVLVVVDLVASEPEVAVVLVEVDLVTSGPGFVTG
jgi:hypothetical protein